MKRMVVLLGLIIFLACNKVPTIDNDTMLDGDKIYDASLYNPETYLVSAANPHPTPDDLIKPVVIAAHGYSATTFEWDEFRHWAGENRGFLISQVLLGGHGRDYESFKDASWQDWQVPIKEEYTKLYERGYQNINFLMASTSCPLLLELVKEGFFNGKVIPHHVLFVDPIVIPSDKMLSLVGIVGPMIGYVELEMTAEEEGHWYHFRPQETLRELEKLLTTVRKDLQRGITLPAETRLKVYKSKKDPAADPVSAVLIYKGVKGHVDVKMIDSEFHVFTRLEGRSDYTQKDVENQLAVFEDIRQLVMMEK